MWPTYIYSDSVYPFSCLLTMVISVYGLISWGSLLRPLKHLIVDFYQKQMIENMEI